MKGLALYWSSNLDQLQIPCHYLFSKFTFKICFNTYLSSPEKHDLQEKQAKSVAEVLNIDLGMHKYEQEWSYNMYNERLSE